MSARQRILPSWANAYRAGGKVGRSQALMAYADYYCLDGIADDMGDVSIERITLHRAPLQPYASRNRETGSLHR